MAFIYFATQIDKCREKVWKKGVEFEEGKKDLSSKGLFPLLKYRPLFFYLLERAVLLLHKFVIQMVDTFPQKVDMGHAFVFSIFFVEYGCVTIYIYSIGGIAIVNLPLVAVS